MPFVKISVEELVEQKREESETFRKNWDESREEYRLIGEMISLRKSERITQKELANLTGNKQQMISRIENKENMPTLRTFCNLLNAIGYELKIVKKSWD